MNRNTFRHGNTMIAVESQPAIISFAKILAATQVVEDHDNNEAPWENRDGWEHTAKEAHRLDNADVVAMQGYCTTRDGRKRLVLQLPPKEDYGMYEYARASGASRQVAAELSAASRRQTLAQLVKWYEEGWQWYGVRCHFEILGEEYEASLWEIDDPDYAAQEITVEIEIGRAHV